VGRLTTLYRFRMPDLNDLVQSVFSGGNLQALSEHLGTSPDETASGIAAALPALLGALAGNVSTPRGEETLASTLQQHHDGSILDSLGGMLTGSFGGKAADGAGILGHLFGDSDHQNEVINSLAGRSGVSPALISRLMPLLAPLVMGWLGRQLRAKVSGGAGSGGAGSGGQQSDTGGGMGGGVLGGLLGSVLSQMMGGGSGGSNLADLLGGLLGGNHRSAPAAQARQQQQSGGIDLGSILGSIFGR
jgi:hypothetical protein